MTIVAITGYGQFLVGEKGGTTTIIDSLKIILHNKGGGN
jgi:hypothetical protein